MTASLTGGADAAPICARALWFPEAGACEIRDEAIAAPGEGEVLVRMLYSGISRGTEALVFHGKVPVSEEQRMRGPHMGGDFPFPVKYGYAAVGEVVDGCDELSGKSVFCLHPHQDRFVVAKGMVTALPEALPARRAVLAANMETALNIVWDAGVQPGDRVAVFGAGVVGSLVAFLSRQIVGTETLLIDRDPGRRDLASSLGLAFADSNAVDGEFDILINASGAAAALGDALEHAGQEARIVEASWHGDRVVGLPLGGAFHSKRLSIVSSQVGAIPAARRARWDFARRLAKALDLLCDDRLDALISGETAFDTLATSYPDILSDPHTLCHRIRY
ncbi:zinc-dependent alcohol dehydrogenase [Rhizobium halophytocola]|uniref:2-desacetyl-2-hydroxyethyl bacteriochlorophyllide A dehydrogenase n=1 Tax=Rhizobium halophytocola TaxID=735519 RepID=A0ABS4DUV0_9HYPH|nr:zinc-binding alcohol dehydrogenase [Rhizobium halophytocola]MBP1849481.1 2-desacetyl-2-hydroxyethyl bacteriochlorophyllide A dehydrogenase [Rhizobium halophytocola]